MASAELHARTLEPMIVSPEHCRSMWESTCGELLELLGRGQEDNAEETEEQPKERSHMSRCIHSFIDFSQTDLLT